MTPTIDIRDLCQLDARQIDRLRRLKIPEPQIEFGGSFEQSVAECLDGAPPCMRGFGILVDAAPVGLVILKRPPCSPDWASDDMVTLHALKIGANWQGLGYGRAALSGALTMCRSIWPRAKRLALSVDADNTAALSLYRSVGMTDSGPVFQGRIGLEHRLCIALD